MTLIPRLARALRTYSGRCRVGFPASSANPGGVLRQFLAAAALFSLGFTPGVHGSDFPGTNLPAASTVPKRVVVLGDSLAAGLGVDPSEAFPALLQVKIDAAGLNYTVINAGVSGDTSADGVNRINWLLKIAVDVLILELGGNDGLRGIPAYATKTNLQLIIDRVKHSYPRAQILVAGMQMPPNMGQQYTAEFKSIFPELAEQNHAALVPFLLEGVAGKPELNQTDHIHPTREGHEIIAENVWTILKPLLHAHAGAVRANSIGGREH